MRHSGEKRQSSTARGQNIVGHSPALLQALDRARHAARTNADILVEAESGTGKELLARFIHDTSRGGKSLLSRSIAQRCLKHLLESELFGHVRGAFTGATARKSGKFEQAKEELCCWMKSARCLWSLQPKLLRGLQERQVGGWGTRAPLP